MIKINRKVIKFNGKNVYQYCKVASFHFCLIHCNGNIPVVVDLLLYLGYGDEEEKNEDKHPEWSKNHEGWINAFP